MRKHIDQLCKYVYHILAMTKTQAIRAFGSVRELAEALSITRHAIYQWPEDLPQSTCDRVTGAALRLGKPLPNA